MNKTKTNKTQLKENLMNKLKNKLQQIFNIKFEIDYCGMSGTSSLIAHLKNDLMFVVQPNDQLSYAPTLSNYTISTVSTINYSLISYSIKPY